jgi:anaerobic selenocysteine-containing dehydrogenase
MGAIPNKLPGFQDIEKDPEACARYEQVCGVPVIRKYGRNLTQMFEAMEHGALSGLYVIGENPASSEADVGRARKLLGNLDTLIVQDLFMTKTAKMADVVLPASNSAFESEGTVTNSERRVQRVRKALEPPGDAQGRHLDHRAAREAARAGLGRGHAALGVGRAPGRLADARRDDLRTPRGARRDPVALLGRGAPGTKFLTGDCGRRTGTSAVRRRRSA